jgi:hypothetical protein
MLRTLSIVGILLLAPALPVSAQDVHLAVIVGLAGDPEHGETFQKWASTLVDTASQRFGIPRERIVYLAEKPDSDPKRVSGRSTKEEIVKAFDAMGKASGPDDLVFIVLFGHGTFDGRVAKFNLPGPDMTAEDFEPLLKRFSTQRVVMVNTASASGPFIQALSGPGRTVVTATRNGAERFATLFGGFFVDALTDASADADKNRRVTVLEAFDFARREVATAYERQGVMLTEHALLDDSGDREGAAQPSAEGGKDGRVASILALGEASGGEPLSADPKIRALQEERRAIERRVESLRLLKDSMPAEKYASDLEKLLTDLALKTRQLREAEKGR